ncbi:S-formylglutathione hydrolase FrmB [Chryseobacterium vietnamense]|uniref:alpha/beta hydrolase n=1 Tax=Chryseobacterium vietnamense TaxID=866785 RepID=UPI00285A5583|nr:alpha/beta hydrolase-fold protein [Chryseobacterium vietnamense]MDR6488759.1 S-formylglutathione hydrolase FrmB [Chryseobacterium vietnamense]
MYTKNILLIIGLLINLQLFKAQEKWVLKSRFISKPDTVLIFKPKTYDMKEKYPLVYLLHGYSENYRQWSQTTDLQKFSDQYKMIIVCPDGFTTWYINSPYDKGSRAEDFFFKELIPKVHKNFSIDKKNIFISGLSMGGYGAIRYFLLHQDYFNTAGSTSGAFSLDSNIIRNASLQFFNTTRITDDLNKTLGSPEEWSQYNISTLLKAYNKGNPFLIDCGTEDILYPSTIEIRDIADSLKIPITFISQPGNHNTEYWKKSIEHHFVFFRQHFK